MKVMFSGLYSFTLLSNTDVFMSIVKMEHGISSTFIVSDIQSCTACKCTYFNHSGRSDMCQKFSQNDLVIRCF